MAATLAELPAAEEFLSEGLITSVLDIIKTGKEASAYLCRAHPSLGHKYAVLKVYHERTRRNFANSTAYTEGRIILSGQVARAVASKSETGRAFESAIWIDYEYEALNALYDAGADVPEPFASNEHAILMEYVGRGREPAPQLQVSTLERDEAAAVLDRLVWNVETWLRHNLVHADLSAYNVLYLGEGRVKVIDFPQAVDPRFAPASRRLFERDLSNLGRYFARTGIAFDAPTVAEDLWERWRLGRL